MAERPPAPQTAADTLRTAAAGFGKCGDSVDNPARRHLGAIHEGPPVRGSSPQRPSQEGRPLRQGAKGLHADVAPSAIRRFATPGHTSLLSERNGKPILGVGFLEGPARPSPLRPPHGSHRRPKRARFGRCAAPGRPCMSGHAGHVASRPSSTTKCSRKAGVSRWTVNVDRRRQRPAADRAGAARVRRAAAAPRSRPQPAGAPTANRRPSA